MTISSELQTPQVPLWEQKRLWDEQVFPSHVYEWPEDVADGVAWLDEACPGWETRINLRTLDVTSPVFCILGQLFGSYANGVRASGQDELWSMRHGFISRSVTAYASIGNMSVAQVRTNCVLLTDLWRAVIMARRAEDAYASAG